MDMRMCVGSDTHPCGTQLDMAVECTVHTPTCVICLFFASAGDDLLSSLPEMQKETCHSHLGSSM